MPTFPTYHGELPESLNPLNLRHYWLLAYWIFFRPTALNCYLYKAAPDLYPRAGFTKFLATFKVRAYRNLYLMAIGASLLWVGLIALAVILYSIGTLQGHSASINTIAVISNQQAISASAGDFRYATTLKVWDLERGALLQTLEGHTKGVNAVAGLPGNRAISGGADRAVKIWDLEQGKLLRTLQGHSRWINAIAVTPDAQQAVSVSADGKAIVWNLQTGKKLHAIQGHEGSVNAVALTPDGQQFISGGADGTVKVWNLQQGTLIRSLEGHTTGITQVAVTPNGQQAISASTDGTVNVWNLSQGTLAHSLKGHSSVVNALAIAPDSQQAVSASIDRTVKVWNLPQGRLIHSLEGHSGGINALAITPDGQRAISASSDHTLKIWDIQQGKLLHTLVGHEEWVRTVAVTPDGQRAISGAGDRFPKLWNLNTGQEIPLKTAKRNLFLASLGLTIVAILGAIAGLFVAALFIACSFMAFGVAGSTLSALLIALAGSFAFGGLFVFADLILINPSFRQTFGAVSVSPNTIAMAFAIVLGTIWFVAFSLAGRTAVAVFASLALILAIGVGVGLYEASLAKSAEAFTRVRLVSGAKAAWRVGTIFNLLVAIGALRVLFYPFELVQALRSYVGGKHHPVQWDELVVLPLPGTQRYLLRQLQRDETQGLHRVAQVVRNPFQRIAAHRALHAYLHSTATPLHFLYTVLSAPNLNAYALAPASAQDWVGIPTTRQVFLAELGNQWIGYSSDWLNGAAERFVWMLTWVRRSHRRTPLTRFAQFLYKLRYKKTMDAEMFHEFSHTDLTLTLSNYPGGVEIAETFAVLETFLSYQTLSDLSAAPQLIHDKDIASLYEREGSSLVPIPAAIRPQLLTAIARLADIGVFISTSEQATTESKQLSALVNAMAALDAIEEYVLAEVVIPEQIVVLRIVRQWRKVVSSVMGEVAKAIA